MDKKASFFKNVYEIDNLEEVQVTTMLVELEISEAISRKGEPELKFVFGEKVKTISEDPIENPQNKSTETVIQQVAKDLADFNQVQEFMAKEKFKDSSVDNPRTIIRKLITKKELKNG